MEEELNEIILKEEIDFAKTQKRIWLIVFFILFIPGLVSFSVFIRYLIIPDIYTGDPESQVLTLTIKAFIPLIFIFFMGVIFFVFGFKSSFTRLRIGMLLALIGGYGFVPFGADVVITEWKNRPINYDELSLDELKERAVEDNDKYAELLYKKREELQEKKYYVDQNNEQLQMLWKASGDLKAYEELRKRYLYYRAERIKYVNMTVTELQKKYSQEKDYRAWFEIQVRKQVLANGGTEYDFN